VGWKAQSPGLYNALLALVAKSLSGTIEATFITGQVGGSAPPAPAPGTTPNPWLNGNEWWVWDPLTAQYQPSQQGCPVGTIMMWGAPITLGIPPRWLLCNGAAVSRTTYSRLYNAIGLQWGNPPGKQTFLLPPTNCFYMNAAGFSADPTVPMTDNGWSDGTAARGGKQNAGPLQAMHLPSMHIAVPYLAPDMINQGGPDVPNIQGQGNQTLYPVLDENGNVLGSNQQRFSIMPPFVTVHYLVKYM
jgi:Phage Tail Collar Domain